METWALIDLISLLIVTTLTGFLIPQILLIAFKKQLFDIPDGRKVHKQPVPRLGGLAFLPVILFTVLLTLGIGMMKGSNWLGEIPDTSLTETIFLSCGALSLYLVGIADDLIGVRYMAKFIVQIFAAILLVVANLVFNDFHGLFGIDFVPTWLAVIITILLIVFITNAINLIDGIDGLASGLSAIACLVYGVILYENGLFLFSQVAFCLLAALVTFFAYNVFGDANRHRKIFMGDTGALTVGIILSALSLRLCNELDAPDGYNYAVVAFSPLLVPCMDVVRVYLHRIRNHTNPFLPDKNHIHHKLLAAGLHQRVAMITIVSFSALLSALNIWLSRYVNITVLLCLDVLLFIVINIGLSRRIALREAQG